MVETHYQNISIPESYFNLTNIEDELNIAKLIAATVEHPAIQMSVAESILDAKYLTEKIASIVADLHLPTDVIYAELCRIVKNTAPEHLEAFEHFMKADNSIDLEDQVRAMIASVPMSEASDVNSVSSESESSGETGNSSVNGNGNGRICNSPKHD